MKRGFTLIELLVVVLIIGILSAVALPQYQVAVAKSRYTQAMVLAESFRRAEQLYYMANGSYSYDFNDMDIGLPAGWSLTSDGRTASGNKTSCWLSDGTAGGAYPTVYCSMDFATYYPVFGNENTKLCGAKNELGHKVCKSLGGIYHSSVSDGAVIYYKLP